VKLPTFSTGEEEFPLTATVDEGSLLKPFIGVGCTYPMANEK